MTSMQRSTPGKDGKMIMDKAWEKVQQKTFTKWVNSHLRKRGKDAIIEDIQTDFNDGLKLIQFLEVISTKNDWSKRYDKKPRMKIQKIQNVDMCMKFLKSEGVKLVAIQAENIIDGDLTLILGMIWTIIQQYQIADISEEELTAKEALLLWCQKKTKGYEGVDPPGIKNFHTNWADGLALCALIHRHRPDLLDYSKCDKSTPRENCKLAFEVAEEKLGIPQLLDVEDLCDTAKPDERSVITYVVQYYHVFAASQKGEVAGRRVGKLVDFERAVEKLRNEYNERAAALVKWIEAKLEWLEDRELGETEDEIAAKLAEYNQYRQTEKPEKAAEKAGVEALFNSIQVKLSSNDRPAFVPADGCAPGAINELWAKLLEAEHAKELALRGARKREKELALLNSRLDDKAARLAAWIEKSEAYLAREESVASVGAAQSKLLELEAWQGEYADAKPRVAELHDLAAQIAALNAPNAADAKARADDLGGRYDALAGAADAKKAALDAALKLEQDKEAARIAWAKAAKEYVRWTKAACESADDDRYFGDSVDAVNGDKARVDAAAEATGADNAAKKAVVDECWAALEALGVADNNRYSSLTRADTDAASERVGAAVEARAAAWADALAAEEAKEAKRKEFAAAAAAFNEAVEARRAALTAAAAEGEPAAACEQLDAVYDGGAPEQAALAALAALHDECTALGITSNRHTRDNNASLTARAARLGRFVESKKAALRREEALKSDYETRARALLAWRDGAAPGIESRDISNSLEDAREQRAVFQTYRTNEKAEKVNEKVALSKLAKQIARVLEKNSRPPFAPGDDVAQASVVKAFLELDKAEAAKADFLAQYLARMEELDLLTKRFAGDERDLQAWLDEKEAYVAETAAIDSLMRGQYAKVVHHSYDEEYAHRAERVAALTGLAAEIAALDHADKAQIEAQAAAVQARYDALKASADSKRDAIDAALKLEQEKEDARIAYAGAATDLERHAAEAVAAIADRTFGFTLDAVSAHADVLAASDADATAAVDERHAAVAAAAKQCDELACGENAHTALTLGDADASRQAVVDALAARRADYDAELGKQQRWDAARLAFAADADAFVAWLAEQRKAVGATEGDADARTAAIRAIHQDGAPGAAKVGELRASADAMRADGVVGNEHTGLTVPLLEARNAQFDRFVASALANIEDEKEAEAKEAEAAAAAAAAEQKEQEQFDFQKAAKVLLNWLASAGAFLTEPIAAASVDEVDALKAELAAFNEQLAQREPDYADLEGKAATVNDGSLFDALRAKWAESKELAAKRAADLDAERAAQEANEALRVAFAEQATALRAFIDAQSGKLAATSGDLAAQKDALAALAAENAGGEAQVEATQAAQVALDDAGVNDNPHTNLTADQLQREYKSLLDATSEKQKLVDEELAAKEDSGVSPAQIAEWRAVFSHFDKDKSQTLQDYELRACLNSLGDDPSDAELKSIVDKFKNADKGQVDFEGFQQLMLERNTDSQTQESSLDNWRVIAGDKDFVTEQDMAMAGMEPSHVEYLKSVMPKNDDGYDYKTWTEGCFAN